MIALVAALAASAAAGAITAGSPAATARPGFIAPAVSVMNPRTDLLLLQAAFRGGYPGLGAAVREGLAGGLEFAGSGRFDHARVDWPGAGARRDSDEFQAGLRFGTPVGARPGLSPGASIGGGFSRGYDRTKFEDGRYAIEVGRAWWAELAGGAGIVAGARAALVERYLHDVPTGKNVHATVLSAESPGWNGASLLAEFGILLSNPLKWQNPWAAGLRLGGENGALDVYATNTRGMTVPGELRGTSDLFYTVRLLLSI